MKTKFISYFLFMLAMSMFAACSSDDSTDNPTNEPEPEGAINTYNYKEKVIEAKSVICTDIFNGSYCIYMSPLMNLETVEDFATSGREYVTFMIPQASVDKEMSLMDSENGCTFYYIDENNTPILAYNNPETWESVSDGKLSIKLTDEDKDGVYEVKANFNITFKDGKSFNGNSSCTYTPPTPLVNQVTDGDEIREIKSALSLNLDGYQYIFLSPVENLKTMDDFYYAEDYMYIGLNPTVIGAEAGIDIATEKTVYTLSHGLKWKNAAGLEDQMYISNDSWDDYCQSGNIKVESLENNKVKLSFNLRMLSGKAFRCAYEGNCIIESSGPSSTNALTVDNLTQEIEAAFYTKQEGVTGLYLTPSGITSFDDVFNVLTYFVYVAVPDAALDGRSIDLSDPKSNYSVMYYNPSTEQSIWADPTNPDSPKVISGTYSIKAGSNENEYEVKIENVKLDNMTISGNYKGTFMSDAPAAKKNEYHLGGDGTPVAINSVVIDQTDKTTVMCDVYLSNTSGLTTVDAIKAANPIILHLDKTSFEGETQSFSHDHGMSITYEGITYNYEASNGTDAKLNGGNAIVTLADDDATIEFNLYQIVKYESKTLAGYYNGKVTVIK